MDGEEENSVLCVSIIEPLKSLKFQQFSMAHRSFACSFFCFFPVTQLWVSESVGRVIYCGSYVLMLVCVMGKKRRGHWRTFYTKREFRARKTTHIPRSRVEQSRWRFSSQLCDKWNFITKSHSPQLSFQFQHSMTRTLYERWRQSRRQANTKRQQNAQAHVFFSLFSKGKLNMNFYAKQIHNRRRRRSSTSRPKSLASLFFQTSSNIGEERAPPRWCSVGLNGTYTTTSAQP